MVVNSTKYYDLLDVPLDASQKNIRKSFRKKKESMTPKKGNLTPEVQEELYALEDAYEVLIDPGKREVYNIAGEDGIALLESVGDRHKHHMRQAFEFMFRWDRTTERKLTLAAVSVGVIIILLAPIFWCLRLDGKVSWNWFVVLIPTWIAEVAYYYAYFSWWNPLRNLQSRLRVLYTLTKVIAVVMAQIFIALWLNDDIHWSVIYVLAPYFVRKMFSLADAIIEGINVPSKLKRDSLRLGIATTTAVMKLRRTFLRNTLDWIASTLFWATQALLIALKVDGNLGDTSWWVVFVPAWFFEPFRVVVLNLWGSTTKEQKKTKELATEKTFLLQKQDGDKEEAENEEADEDNEHQAVNPPSNVWLPVIILPSLVSWLLLAARLEGGSFSTFYIVLPVFIAPAFGACCFCCIAWGLAFTKDNGSEQTDAESPKLQA